MNKQKTIRVIAPSQSWQQGKLSAYRRAIRSLEATGYSVDFGTNIKERDSFGTASIESRVADLHDAFTDSSVRVVLCLDGGWSANQLLPHIHWELLKANPKPIIGYSDCTVLLNAIYARTGRVTYLGPLLTTLGDKDTGKQSLAGLTSALEKTDYRVERGSVWKSGGTIFCTERRWNVLNTGTAEGVLIGGNLGSLYLLQGTPYMPTFRQDTILAIEDDDEAGINSVKEFDRRLESILQQSNARRYIVGVIVGRFQISSGVTRRAVTIILRQKFASSIPIVCDVGFGHTLPMATLRLGGTMRMELNSKNEGSLYVR